MFLDRSVRMQSPAFVSDCEIIHHTVLLIFNHLLPLTTQTGKVDRYAFSCINQPDIDPIRVPGLDPYKISVVRVNGLETHRNIDNKKLC